MKKVVLMFLVGVSIGVVFLGCASTETYKNRGNQYYIEKKYEMALNAYNKALKIDPNYAKAIYGIGRVYLIQDKYDEALVQYNKAIEIGITIGSGVDDATVSIMYDARCRLYYYIYKKYDLALDDCEAALAWNPDNDSAKELFKTMNLRKFTNVQEAIDKYVEECYKYTMFLATKDDLFKDFLGYHVSNRDDEITIWIEKPNRSDGGLIGGRYTLSSDIPLSFNINQNLRGIYFKFPYRRDDNTEINQEFYNAFIRYLDEKKKISKAKK